MSVFLLLTHAFDVEMNSSLGERERERSLSPYSPLARVKYPTDPPSSRDSIVASSLGSDFSVSENSKWGKLLRTVYENSKAKAVDEFNVSHSQANGGAAANTNAGFGDA